MHWGTGVAFVQAVACLFGAKPLPEPVLTYCQLSSKPCRTDSGKFESKYKTFHSWKCIWKECEMAAILSREMSYVKYFWFFAQDKRQNMASHIENATQHHMMLMSARMTLHDEKLHQHERHLVELLAKCTDLWHITERNSRSGFSCKQQVRV